MSRGCILVIDDDECLLRLVRLALIEEGYEVFCALSGREGLQQLWDRHPDLVILDIMMPGIDGWETCRRIREVSEVAIIMLSARGELPSRLKGLSIGADDYLPKPFNIEELLLRVKAVLKRVSQRPHMGGASIWDDGHLSISLMTREVFRDGNPVDLSLTEFDILAYLVQNAERVVSQEELLKEVWGERYKGTGEQVKVYISRLRHKLEPEPLCPRYILTIRGKGYRFGG